jgi:ribosomal protein L24
MGMKIRRHDEVVVITGEDKGKRGRVLAWPCFPTRVACSWRASIS